MRTLIVEAIQNRVRLNFDYNGYGRTVEPHTLGISSHGNVLLRAYQTSGGSSSGSIPAWRLFNADRITALTLDSSCFQNPRPGYTRGDSAMTGGIIEEL